MKHPKLIITEHYESLIYQIDLRTEKLLEKYSDRSQIREVTSYRPSKTTKPGLDNKTQTIFEIDSKIFEYKCDFLEAETSRDEDDDLIEVQMMEDDVVGQVTEWTKIHDYLNRVREILLAYLKGSENKTLDYYQNCKQFIDSAENLTGQDCMEEVRQRIFAQKFCTIIDHEVLKSQTSQFKSYAGSSNFDINLKLFSLSLVVFDSYASYNLFLRNKVVAYLTIDRILNDKNVLKRFWVRIDMEKILQTKQIVLDKKSVSTGLTNVAKMNTFKIDQTVFERQDFSFLDTHLPTIRSLSVQENSLESRSVDNILDLGNIRYFHLTYGNMTMNCMNGFKCLMKLVLTKCKFDFHLGVFLDLDTLQYLKIEHTVINWRQWANEYILPQNLKHFELIKSSHVIFDLNHKFPPDLKSLTLIDTDQAILEPGKLTKLESLVLVNNPNLELTSDMFDKRHKLKYLSLSKFKHSSKYFLAKDFFTNLPHLTHLRLTDSMLRYFYDDLFVHTPKITHLDLSGNFLKLNERTFHLLPKLKFLNLSSNGLQTLPDGVFGKLVDLETLSLAHNKLTDVDEKTLHALSSLKNFDISFNNLKITQKILDKFKGTGYLACHENSQSFPFLSRFANFFD